LTDSETMSPAAPLGIVHIPKTGGYAVRSALSAVCRLDESPAYHDAQLIAGTSIRDLPRPTQDTFVTARQLREIGRGRQVLIGHYSAPTLVAAGCAELAVQLREPRSRLLSLYRYWQSQQAIREEWGPWGLTALGSSDLPFDKFITSPGVWPATSNAVARQLLVSRTPKNPRSAGRMTWNALNGKGYDALIARLSIVEWGSESQRFVDRICAKLAIDEPVVVPRENVTHISGCHQILRPSDRNHLDEATQLDREIIARLTSIDILPRRTSSELDDEFELTATRLGFDLR
jgi:hypothetical protein